MPVSFNLERCVPKMYHLFYLSNTLSGIPQTMRNANRMKVHLFILESRCFLTLLQDSRGLSEDLNLRQVIVISYSIQFKFWRRYFFIVLSIFAKGTEIAK